MPSIDSKRVRAVVLGSTLGTSILFLGACLDSPTLGSDGQISCDLDNRLLQQTVPPNAIPAINNPTMVDADDGDAAYLFDEDRVLGVVIDGMARAYPHNILWHHEIVNDRIGGTDISVTFCPLTGSGMAFDPRFEGRVLDLGVSGLLFANNLVLYDRDTEEVYGPQLTIEGSCSIFRGSELGLMPVQEMSWGRWKALHPDTKVIAGDQGFSRNYRIYPYGTYDQLTDESLLNPMNVDRSRPIKERVLAIRSGRGGMGYPFGELADLGSVVALNETLFGVPTAIFFEARDGSTALAFDARVNGTTLMFDADPTGFWTDRETGSTWSVDGTAIDGPLVGERLQTRSDAYTLFWFAWRHFQPDGETFSQ